MLSLGPIAILNPAILGAFVVLPLVWLLVRALPPRARRVTFPPMLLLRGLSRGEPPPDRTPWWVLLLRLLVLALVILSLARPVLNPGAKLGDDGPILIVVDNGWEAASRWGDREAALKEILEQARRENRPVILLPTAPGSGVLDASGEITAEVQSARQALESLPSLQPRPWSPDHARTARAVDGLGSPVGGPAPGHAIWLSDGIEYPGSGALHQALSRIRAPDIRTDRRARHPIALSPPQYQGLDIALAAVRPVRPFAEKITIEALGGEGQRIGEVQVEFGADKPRARGILKLPQRLRNAVTRLQITGEESAGAVVLLDARAGRPLVGISDERGMETAPPLTTASYYLSRALEPYAALTRGNVTRLLEQEATLIFMASRGVIDREGEEALFAWVKKGGVLVGFADPQAGASSGTLLPVSLRSGDRATGGALTWDKPKHLQPFPESSPFFGIAVGDGVTVTRQLLAVPEPDLARKTWARLEDGTPIVTADNLGQGWLILFHTTANSEWSNLAHSGLFVEMLRRLLPLARGQSNGDIAKGIAMLSPNRVMNGRGALQAAPPGTRPIARADLANVTAGPDTPPGLYGPEGAALALNLVSSAGPVDGSYTFKELDRNGRDVTEGLVSTRETDLGPILLALALLLALADILAGLWLRGLIRLPVSRAAGAAGALAVAMVASIPRQGTAQEMAQEMDEAFAVAATRQTRLAWVSTGNRTQDNVVEAGLVGLGRILRIRTAVSLGEPQRVDPEADPLDLFPLIYWPLPPGRQLSETGARRLSAYLSNGGMVLFDTGIADPTEISLGLQRPESQASLRLFLKGIDLPGLAPVDSRHVLSKSYYLLERFPGRIQGRQVWVERGTDRTGQAVTGVVIGGGDWASAWAVDALGMPLVRSLAGGEWQRELAYRFGVNLVMYALTGNYKDDQLHLPVLMNRLGE